MVPGHVENQVGPVDQGGRSQEPRVTGPELRGQGEADSPQGLQKLLLGRQRLH